MAWPDDVTRADLDIKFTRGSGPGGQHKNKTDSACRITHKPTGEVGYAEDERRQLQNKKLAFRRLAAKLVPVMVAAARRKMPESKPNTDRIRTYNEKRGTVVDHRIPGQTFSLEKVLDGDLTQLITAIMQKMIETDLEEL